MAIDYKDWKGGIIKAEPTQGKAYIHIGDRAMWQQMLEWIDSKISEGTKSVTQAILDLQLSGDYSYEFLVKRKALIDIRQAELRIMEAFREKIVSYQQDHETEDAHVD